MPIAKIRAEINESKARQLGRIVKKLRYKPISFNSPDLFPEGDEFIYTNYMFFLVAIDHRTHPENKRFEAEIGGKFYHGSDLMYFLARKIQKERPDFFTAENLVRITAKDLTKVFSIGNVTIRGVAERAMLLRDCAKKLIDYHKGDFRNLLRSSEGYLLRMDKKGVLQQLRTFKAYEDPLMKKSFLLIKILKRQKYFEPADVENLSLPVDNVLLEVGLRSGVVNVANVKDFEGVIKLSKEDVEILRNLTKEAFEIVSRESKVPPDILDDLIWTFGREVYRIERDKIDKIENIVTPLNANIENKKALKDFLTFISYNVSIKFKFPNTWYF